jgi:hypothetical protein
MPNEQVPIPTTTDEQETFPPAQNFSLTPQGTAPPRDQTHDHEPPRE